MRVVAFIVVIYILTDIQRRIKDRDRFVTQKQFADFKTAQAATNAQIDSRLNELESSSFS